jgi:hypothetical protein
MANRTLKMYRREADLALSTPTVDKRKERGPEQPIKMNVT